MPLNSRRSPCGRGWCCFSSCATWASPAGLHCVSKQSWHVCWQIHSNSFTCLEQKVHFPVWIQTDLGTKEKGREREKLLAFLKKWVWSLHFYTQSPGHYYFLQFIWGHWDLDGWKAFAKVTHVVKCRISIRTWLYIPISVHSAIGAKQVISINVIRHKVPWTLV